MTSVKSNRPQSNKNVMEIMVAEEVKRQLRNYPPKLVKYLNKIEVETYALNRLPPLYACSEEGWRKQKERAEAEFLEEIVIAVRQAFAAVQRDPLRFSTPIALENKAEFEEARKALTKLQEILKLEEPTWKHLAKVAKRELSQATYKKMTQEEKEQLLSEPSDRWTQYHEDYNY